MSDNNVIDKIAPWTIKAVATETRQTVIEAARQESLTVGQWLEKRVIEWADQSQTSSALTVRPQGKQVYNRADPVDVIRAALEVAPLLTDEARATLMRSVGAAARRLLVDVGR